MWETHTWACIWPLVWQWFVDTGPLVGGGCTEPQPPAPMSPGLGLPHCGSGLDGRSGGLQWASCRAAPGSAQGQQKTGTVDGCPLLHLTAVYSDLSDGGRATAHFTACAERLFPEAGRPCGQGRLV